MVREGSSEMSTVCVALANVRAAATPEESVVIAKAAIEEAGRREALVVCFPECFVPGYRWRDTTLPPPDTAVLERARAEVADAARTAGVTVILGTERVTDRGLQISACVIHSDGTLAGWQDKGQLDPSEESTYPAVGTERQVFTAGPLTFGIVICHEGWRYPETVRWAVRRGAQVMSLSEDQAGEVVEVVLPYREGVPSDIDLPDMRHVVRGEVVVHALADVEQGILVAAGHPQQLQHLGRPLRLRHELRGRHRVRRRREASDVGEDVQIAEPEVQGLTAAHRKSGERARLAIADHGVARLDVRNQVIDELALERRIRLELDPHRVAARASWTRAAAASGTSAALPRP